MLPVLSFILSRIKPETQQLKTPFEDGLTDTPWQEYPRPQFKRDSYLCLNGKWDLSVKSGKKTENLGKILVPFVPESRISGINRHFKKNDILIYKKTFTLPDGFKKERVILHFGAADQETVVFVNGQSVGSNIGGYIPFSFDITEYLTGGENELSVHIADPLCTDLPYGKQRKKRGGMWYTPISGIWQTVWLESVCNSYIKDIKITPTLSDVTIEVSGGNDTKQIVFEGKTHEFTGSSYTLTVENPINWTPENPYLYNFTLISGQDKVDSYFALRTVEIKGTKILLNGKPYFFHGLLDQGYFSDGIFLPATEKGFLFDIETMKDLGFNTLRKHIKIEPDLFYYYCDKQGMIVFQDIINSGKYSFLIDTALPTIGLKKGIVHSANARRREQFEKCAKDTVNLLYNHPCICYYTLFNEGWGQYDTDRIYEEMKELDSTRVWDAASGWFETEKNDVISEHIYFKPVKTKTDGKRPAVLSEFGGYSYKITDHSFNRDKTYGYKFFTEAEKFMAETEKLYNNEIISAIKNGLCGAILTQVSDVEDETNGLVTYDRQVIKVDTDRMQKISQNLFSAFDEL